MFCRVLAISLNSGDIRSECLSLDFSSTDRYSFPPWLEPMFPFNLSSPRTLRIRLLPPLETSTVFLDILSSLCFHPTQISSKSIYHSLTQAPVTSRITMPPVSTCGSCVILTLILVITSDLSAICFHAEMFGIRYVLTH